MLADPFIQPFHQPPPGRVQPFVGAGLTQHLQRGKARNCRDRIPRERADLEHESLLPHPARVEVGHDLLATRDRSERIAPAARLAEGAEIRGNAVDLLRSSVGHAETGDDLVEDEHDVVLCGQLPQPFEEPLDGRDDALHRLDDDPCDLVAVLPR